MRLKSGMENPVFCQLQSPKPTTEEVENSVSNGNPRRPEHFTDFSPIPAAPYLAPESAEKSRVPELLSSAKRFAKGNS